MDLADDLELTPSLLKFYRSRIHDLQNDQCASIHSRLKQIELSSQERNTLERELLEYEDELDKSQQDIQDLQNALIRERRAVIELVEENAQLREHSGDRSTDSEAPDRSASRKLQYETLITSLLNDHKTCLSRIRTQRDSTTAKLQDLISRCARLETAVTEGTKELLKERREKQALEGRVEEMQTSIEQRIEKLRKRLIDSGRIERSDERLKLENERLRASLQDFKSRLATQSSSTQDRISELELELDRRKQRDYESTLELNPTLRERIKQIERLALKYAPLQGPEVDHLFSEIEYAKDIISGAVPPPPPMRRPSKRKKKV